MDYEYLPTKDSFYNDLTENNVSSEDYQHCLTIWNEFEMTTFKDYHLLYNLTNVLILTDTMLFFKQIRHDFDLDICKFYSMPGFSLKSALKFSGMVIQLLTDMGMHLFCNFKRKID